MDPKDEVPVKHNTSHIYFVFYHIIYGEKQSKCNCINE